MLDPCMDQATLGNPLCVRGSNLGIEREEEHVEIAKGRIHGDALLFTEVSNE